MLFAPLRRYVALCGTQGIADADRLNALAAEVRPGLTSGAGAPLRFVLPAAGGGYEAQIYERGMVPTRAGDWHDYFNALVWLRFPRTKAALNRRHYEALAGERAAGRANRSAVRDAATLFDESGAVVASADAALDDLLRAHRWGELFWARRSDVLRSMRFFVFGHALYDKLRAPYVGLCAKLVFVEVDAAFFGLAEEAQLEWLDAELAARWSDPARYVTPAALANLPVLGIPGVTPDSECAAYYEDARQFRPQRARAERVPPA
jgi:hypothetical protein